MAEALRVEMWLGDCLEVMPRLMAGSINLMVADLPYGVTDNVWDCRVPLGRFWRGARNVVTQTAVMIFTATNPFAAQLIISNQAIYRYDIVWEKPNAVGFFNARKRPLAAHELMLVFSHANCNSQSRLPMVYNPQMVSSEPYRRKRTGKSKNYNRSIRNSAEYTGIRYPRSVLTFSRPATTIHPTQKPLALLEWLIKTYTNPGDIVLDPCAGSFTTSVAALKTGRNSICIEKDKTYFAAGVERVKAEIAASGVNVDLVVHG